MPSQPDDFGKPVAPLLGYENPFFRGSLLQVEQGEGWIEIRRPFRTRIGGSIWIEMLLYPLFAVAFFGVLISGIAVLLAGATWPLAVALICAASLWAFARSSGYSYSVRATSSQLVVRKTYAIGRPREWQIHRKEIVDLLVQQIPSDVIKPVVWVEAILQDGSRELILPVGHPAEGAWVVSLLKQGKA